MPQHENWKTEKIFDLVVFFCFFFKFCFFFGGGGHGFLFSIKYKFTVEPLSLGKPSVFHSIFVTCVL